MRNRVILAVRGGFVKERQEPAVMSALWAHDRSQTQRQWIQEVAWRVQESDPRNKQVPCQKIAKTRRSPSTIILLTLVTHGSDRHSAAVIDLEKCDIARVAKRDQKLSPAGVFLEQRHSARKRRIGQ